MKGELRPLLKTARAVDLRMGDTPRNHSALSNFFVCFGCCVVLPRAGAESVRGCAGGDEQRCWR